MNKRSVSVAERDKIIQQGDRWFNIMWILLIVGTVGQLILTEYFPYNLICMLPWLISCIQLARFIWKRHNIRRYFISFYSSNENGIRVSNVEIEVVKGKFDARFIGEQIGKDLKRSPVTILFFKELNGHECIGKETKS